MGGWEEGWEHRGERSEEEDLGGTGRRWHVGICSLCEGNSIAHGSEPQVVSHLQRRELANGKEKIKEGVLNHYEFGV